MRMALSSSTTRILSIFVLLLFFGPPDRKPDRHACPFTRFALEKDLSSVRPDDVLDQGKSDAASLDIALHGTLGPVELFEDFFLLGLADADPMILDLEIDGILPGPRPQRDARVFARILHGVVEQIEYRSGESVLVRMDDRQAVPDLRLQGEILEGRLLTEPARHAGPQGPRS